MMSGAKQALLLVAAFGTVLSMTSCREDEMGRPMVKQKGVYEGQEDEQLAEQQLMDLKTRSAGQRF